MKELATYTELDRRRMFIGWACVSYCFVFTYAIYTTITPQSELSRIWFDCSVSFFSTLAALVLIPSSADIRQYPKTPFYIVAGCLLYEPLQPAFGLGVFDWFDVAAILLAGLIGSLLFHSVHKAEQQRASTGNDSG